MLNSRPSSDITTVCWRTDSPRHTTSRISADTTYPHLASQPVPILLSLQLRCQAILALRKASILASQEPVTRLLLNTNNFNNHRMQHPNLSILLMDLYQNNRPVNILLLNKFKEPIAGKTGHLRHLKTRTNNSSHTIQTNRHTTISSHRQQPLTTPIPLTTSHLSNHSRPLSGHPLQELHLTLLNRRILICSRLRSTLEALRRCPHSPRQTKHPFSRPRRLSNLFNHPRCSILNHSSLSWVNKFLPHNSTTNNRHTGSLLCHSSISSHQQRRRTGRMVVIPKILSPQCRSKNLRSSL